MEKEFIDILTRHGWSDHAAQAAFDLGGSHPFGEDGMHPSSRNAKFRDWASASGFKDIGATTTQLAYIDYSLRNLFSPVWKKLNEAKTVEEAKTQLAGFYKLIGRY